jgi:N-acetylglutamate synthase
MNEIALIEELAANAVPALLWQDLDGWRLRFSQGVTRRANSVLLAHHAGRLSLAEKIAHVEAFYARYHVLCRFQLCPASLPAASEALLEAHGYTASPPTLVQVAPLSVLRGYATGQARIAEHFDGPWLAAYAEGEGETNPLKLTARREMLSRIAPLTGFAALLVDGVIAAVALGVVERGHLGIFSVATRPAYRGQGLASALMGDLAVWAAEHGATRAYLQVFSTNRPALRLYERLGFTTLYPYWYREQT